MKSRSLTDKNKLFISAKPISLFDFTWLCGLCSPCSNVWYISTPADSGFSLGSNCRSFGGKRTFFPSAMARISWFDSLRCRLVFGPFSAALGGRIDRSVALRRFNFVNSEAAKKSRSSMKSRGKSDALPSAAPSWVLSAGGMEFL